MTFKNKKVLVTGGAGFIGSNLIKKLLSKEAMVVVIDNFNDYYDPDVKEKNIESFKNNLNFRLVRGDICEESDLEKCFKTKFDVVIHLAAQAGVRYSLSHPQKYYRANVFGTLQLLEFIKKNPRAQLIFGSSSSVYGNKKTTTFLETSRTDSQISPYAASKKAAEILCQTYANLYQINTTILRLFTVYGPSGRPDMAPYIFTQAALENRAIEKFGNGETSRDYTYVDDIVDGIILAIEKPFSFEIINLGNNNPVALNKFIKTIEKTTNKKLKIIEVEQPLGDVNKTYANIDKAQLLLGWQPQTSLEQGLKIFTEWLKNN